MFWLLSPPLLCTGLSQQSSLSASVCVCGLVLGLVRGAKTRSKCAIAGHSSGVPAGNSLSRIRPEKSGSVPSEGEEGWGRRDRQQRHTWGEPGCALWPGVMAWSATERNVALRKAVEYIRAVRFSNVKPMRMYPMYSFQTIYRFIYIAKVNKVSNFVYILVCSPILLLYESKS